QSKVFSDSFAKVGTYDQAKLYIDSVTIKLKTGITKTAKLPANQMTLNTKLVMNEGETSNINFDVEASDSTFMTNLGEYFFAPVIKTSTESSVVLSVDSTGVVTIASGHEDSASSAGMDIDGTVKANFLIDNNLKFSLDNSGKIKIDISDK
ncbi:hypothetical protein K2P96_02855, partial [Patescibacteria group bacterium]|nr:hypothetical protein [Patescibacteria group bacterium]